MWKITRFYPLPPSRCGKFHIFFSFFFEPFPYRVFHLLHGSILPSLPDEPRGVEAQRLCYEEHCCPLIVENIMNTEICTIFILIEFLILFLCTSVVSPGEVSFSCPIQLFLIPVFRADRDPFRFNQTEIFQEVQLGFSVMETLYWLFSSKPIVKSYKAGTGQEEANSCLVVHPHVHGVDDDIILLPDVVLDCLEDI